MFNHERLFRKVENFTVGVIVFSVQINWHYVFKAKDLKFKVKSRRLNSRYYSKD